MEFVQPLRSAEQVERVAAALRAKSLRDWAMFVLGVHSGLRISDLLALRVRDVLAGTAGRVQIRRRLDLRERKTGKRRDFPLHPRARRALAEYLRTRPSYLPEDPVFLSRRHDRGAAPISRTQAYRVMSDAARRCGVDARIGTHTLRKTFAYAAYRSGAGLPEIQKLLRHSSQEVTLAYMGITQEDLDGLFRGTDPFVMPGRR